MLMWTLRGKRARVVGGDLDALTSIARTHLLITIPTAIGSSCRARPRATSSER